MKKVVESLEPIAPEVLFHGIEKITPERRFDREPGNTPCKRVQNFGRAWLFSSDDVSWVRRPTDHRRGNHAPPRGENLSLVRYGISIKALREDGVDALVDESHDGIQRAERPVALDIGEETARAVEVVEVLRGDRFGAAVGTGQ